MLEPSQETADLLQSHLEDNLNLDNEAEIYEAEIYEPMSNSSQDIMMKYSSCTEDIYESMLGLDPECAEDLCKISSVIKIIQALTKWCWWCDTIVTDEVMTVVDENPEEAMLRKFFQGIYIFLIYII